MSSGLQEQITNLHGRVNTYGAEKSATQTVMVNGRECELKAEVKTFFLFKWTQITITHKSLDSRSCEVIRFSFNQGKDLDKEIKRAEAKLGECELDEEEVKTMDGELDEAFFGAEDPVASLDEEECGPPESPKTSPGSVQEESSESVQEGSPEEDLDASRFNCLTLEGSAKLTAWLEASSSPSPSTETTAETSHKTPVSGTATPQVSSGRSEELTSAAISSKIAEYTQRSIPFGDMDARLQEIGTFLDSVENFVQQNKLSEGEMAKLKQELQTLCDAKIICIGNMGSINQAASAGDLTCKSVVSKAESLKELLDAKAGEVGLKEETSPESVQGESSEGVQGESIEGDIDISQLNCLTPGESAELATKLKASSSPSPSAGTTEQTGPTDPVSGTATPQVSSGRSEGLTSATISSQTAKDEVTTDQTSPKTPISEVATSQVSSERSEELTPAAISPKIAGYVQRIAEYTAQPIPLIYVAPGHIDPLSPESIRAVHTRIRFGDMGNIFLNDIEEFVRQNKLSQNEISTLKQGLQALCSMPIMLHPDGNSYSINACAQINLRCRNIASKAKSLEELLDAKARQVGLEGNTSPEG
ncbi:MAG: hypothetical protein LBI47_03195 [Puniceicoccales bacterium]|jgi:hypothetical protein|nr:hypothetical protein [Puniceicoccales bacterium]